MTGGSAAAITKLAKQHPDKFQPGMDAIYLISGDGLGITNIYYEADVHTQPLIQLQMTEIGSLPHSCEVKETGEFSMKPVGGDLEVLLKDFTQALPPRYSVIQKTTLENTQNGKIATDYSMALRYLHNSKV